MKPPELSGFSLKYVLTAFPTLPIVGTMSKALNLLLLPEESLLVAQYQLMQAREVFREDTCCVRISRFWAK